MKQALMAALSAATLVTGTVIAINPAEAFTLKIDPTTSYSSNNPATGASGELDFSFQSVSSDTVRMFLTITNTTGTPNLGATSSKLTGVLFDLPSLIKSIAYESGSNPYFDFFRFDNPLEPPNPNEFNPFSNGEFVGGDLPAGYPEGPFEVYIGNDDKIEGGDANDALPQGLSTVVQFLLTTNSPATANVVEGAFYWGFSSVAGQIPGYPADPLRAALRFQQVEPGDRSDKLLGKPEAIPTPALLPALLGLGAGILRKKQEQDAQEA